MAKKTGKKVVDTTKLEAHKAGRAAQEKVGKGNPGYTEAYKNAYNEVLVARGLAPKYSPKTAVAA